MSTFSRLTLLAQYDDMCRLVNKLIKDGAEEEEATIRMLCTLKSKWNSREQTHIEEKSELEKQISELQKEMKKSKRYLAESRAALLREEKEKNSVAREKKALMEQIRQVRLLVEANDAFETDAHRRRVIKCLDVDRLSTIQSDQSEDSDNCADIDYDKTEEDILDTVRTTRRSGGAKNPSAFRDVLENLPATEQPTILCRYLDKNSDDDRQVDLPTDHLVTGRRRTSRRPATTIVTSQQMAELQARSSSNTRVKHLVDTESESNGLSDNDIERCREQLKQLEEKKHKERLASSTNSTPNMKGLNRAATLNAQSTASLMKINSNLKGPPTPSVMKPHTFASKKSFKPDTCGPCGKKISFYGNVVKCECCHVTCHPECKDLCPLPCVKITAPVAKSRQKQVLIQHYVNNDSGPQVPALIVHCCNEIERGDKIRTRGLYRVVEDSKQIEDLCLRILRSKTGMPNLSNIDVHVLTGVVKRFLQNLDETLITTHQWGRFAEATKFDTDVECLTQIELCIKHDIPRPNRETLSYLMQHFHAIAENSEHNCMTIRDLAKALAPTIVGNSCRNPNQNTLMNENKTQVQIMETLFKFPLDFWEQFVQKICTSNNQEQQQHHTRQSTRTTLGSRLLNNTPTSASGGVRTRSRNGATLPTPKLKPLFSG